MVSLGVVCFSGSEWFVGLSNCFGLVWSCLWRLVLYTFGMIFDRPLASLQG